MRAALILAALMAGGALAGPASAAIPSGNLLVNGNAETGTAAGDSAGVAPPPGWTVTSNFTQVAYGAPGFPTTGDSAGFGGGNAFFAGGPDTAASTADQTVDVAGAAPEIDARGVAASLSAYLGGYASHDDSAEVTATFQDAAGAALGTLNIGPVDAQDRGSVTSLLQRSGRAAVPAGTRKVLVRISTVRTIPSYNDGYADNVVLSLGRADKTLADLPAPVLGKKTNVEPVKGKVLVSVKGGKFVSLGEARQIPVGSVLDTRKGTVRLQTATGSGSKTYKGDFDGGLFKIAQSRRKKDKGLTDLALQGGSLKSCKSAKKARAALSKKALRRLRGSAKGNFRTRGRYSAATVRGTKWTVTDRCDGTLTKVTRGKVAVRDFSKKKTVLVKTGKSYLARAG